MRRESIGSFGAIAERELKTHDVIGIGFGPAGIALAAAIEDRAEEGHGAPWRSLFVEREPDSTWQPNMLMPGTDIQHHYLRDFATPRNPRSRFTFPCYLKETGRLFSFGLLGGNAGRVEWSDYVQWVARQLQHHALYNHDVVRVEPVMAAGDDEVSALRVHAAERGGGAMRTFQARNVVLCMGRRPNVPPVYQPHAGETVFHSHEFQSRVRRLRPEQTRSFAVVGSGQNAIEVLLDLIERFPSATIYSINRNNGFRLYDLGHFSNECYFPEEVDYFHGLSKQSRANLSADVKFTNYSSVDADVSRTLYWRLYEDEVQGVHRIRVIKRSEAVAVTREGGSYRLDLRDVYKHDHQSVAVDTVVLGTGFVEDQVPDCIAPLAPYLDRDGDGDVVISRDYEVRVVPSFTAGLFINGLTERTHGISDAASFSMMALKAQRTLERLEQRRVEAVAGNGLVRR